MKKTYETFSEIANDFTDGEGKAHLFSNHSTESCIAWQTAILEFAKALDLADIPLPNDPQIYESFWKNITQSINKNCK